MYKCNRYLTFLDFSDINYVPVIRNLPLPSALVVSENSATSLSVFQVSIQDNDGGDTHTYTMTSFPSDGMQYFEINSASKLLTLNLFLVKEKSYMILYCHD